MKKSQNKDHFLIKVTDQNAFQICNFDQEIILMFSVYIFLTCHENRHNDMFSYKYLVLVTDLYYSSLHSRDIQLPEQDPDVPAEERTRCFLESVQETFPAVDFPN